ncbi:MAG TPA: redoxin domain-containing protein [Acidobacteriota bacterium]|nr:redoxin domain-containing protein [Acidobacteriota bacterium]
MRTISVHQIAFAKPGRGWKRWPSRLPLLCLIPALSWACSQGNGLSDLSLPGPGTDRVRPFQTPGVKAHVFLFTRADCPVSNRYLPEIRRLKETYGPRGVAFWRVYPDPDISGAAMRQHGQDFAIDIPALRDPSHRLVEAAGVSITPEAAVYLPEGRLVYRGRIDDRYIEFGKYRRVPTRHDLEEVLRDVIGGRPPAFRATRAVGCYIADLRPRGAAP